MTDKQLKIAFMVIILIGIVIFAAIYLTDKSV